MADEEQNLAETGPEDTATDEAMETDEDVIEHDESEEVRDDGDDEDRSDEEGGEGDEPEADADAEEFEDVEYDGKQYKLPKELKEAFLRQQDYTRKTQEVADQRRELETYAQRIAQQSEASEEELQARATYANAEKELERFKDVNWREWHQQDPMAAQDAKMYVDELTRAQQSALQTVQERQQARTQEAQQDYAKRLEETRQFAAKEIKGWSPELARDIEGFLTQEGIDADVIQANMSPKFIRLMYLATLGNKALTQATAPKPKVQAKPIQPLRQVASKSAPGGRKSLAEMDMDEYVKARRQGIGG